jgi:hypothetical protein
MKLESLATGATPSEFGGINEDLYYRSFVRVRGETRTKEEEEEEEGGSVIVSLDCDTLRCRGIASGPSLLRMP